jgi:uncharacterized protein YecE (DUF72 family)
VEVDSTFYHIPTRSVSAHWSDVTPPTFQFSCKVPKEITHERKLRDCSGLVAEFLNGIEPLVGKLGALLIQLPPFFAPKRDEHTLREFVLSLPTGWPWAIEFRDHEWHLPRIVHLLEQKGICWCWNDVSSLQNADAAAFDSHPRTSEFAVVRLMGDLSTKYRGDGSVIHTYNRTQWPRETSVENWAAKVRAEGPELKRVLVFANNHFEGYAPETAQRIARVLGVTLNLPGRKDLHPGENAEQLGLF